MDIISVLPALTPAFPLIACGLIFFFTKLPNVRESFSVGAAIACAVVNFIIANGVYEGNTYSFVLCKLTDTLGFSFHADAAGALFAVVSSFLYVAVAFYAIGYMRGHHEKDQTGFYAFFAMCICSAQGIAYAGNLLTFFVFFEMLTIATWPLVFHERNDEAKFSGRKYLIYTLIPGQILLAGIVVVYMISGTLDFTAGGFMSSEMGSVAQLGVLFFMLLSAGAIKAGMMPFHGWLPSAMIAPTPVSALLHAVAVVKAGAFCVIRVVGYVYGTELLKEIGVCQILQWFAGATIILASVIALSQDNLKRRLAFSTVGQLSYIILGCCILNERGYAGSFYHIVAHALMKITLFMCAGAIIVTTHKTDVSQMHGIGKQMPITMGCFTIASLGIIGLPATVGFISKWNLTLGALEQGNHVYIVILLVSALLGLMYLMPVTYGAFFTKDVTGDFTEYKEADLRMLIPICATTILSVVLGIYPNFFVHLYSLAQMAASAIS
ncbi:MAG: monovalent cation/H+ antiporter subunit D family protein [Eubacterium sp.]|nr:monovalent cation/H+ antiporter subunit D family protein [Eubacterium sp.]